MRHHAGLTAVLLLGAVILFPACKGDTGPAGPAGASTVPTPICSSPSSHGITVASGSTAITAAYYIAAQAVTLATVTTAVSLSIHYASATHQADWGIYSDNGSNYPGILVYAANFQNITPNSWNTVNVPNIYLPAGVYWMVVLNSDSDMQIYNSNGAFYYESVPWGSLPNPFPASATTATQNIPFYIGTCP